MASSKVIQGYLNIKSKPLLLRFIAQCSVMVQSGIGKLLGRTGTRASRWWWVVIALKTTVFTLEIIYCWNRFTDKVKWSLFRHAFKTQKTGHSWNIDTCHVMVIKGGWLNAQNGLTKKTSYGFPRKLNLICI